MTTTTQMGVADNASSVLTEDDAAGIFLSRWSEEDPALSASQTPENEDVTEQHDEVEQDESGDDRTEVEGTETDPDNEESDEHEETDGDEGETTESKPTKEKGKVLDDDHVTKITVDGEELQVSVKDLKRLYGQEAALTKKSQQVATQRKEVEEANQRAAAQLDRLQKKAAARWEPYSKVDMLVAAKQLDNEQFAALRAEAQAAYDDYRFITQEVDQFVKAANEQRSKMIKEKAEATAKALVEKIPGWNNQVYEDVRNYAVASGMPREIADSIVEASALEMTYKAMMYDKAKAVTTKRVNKTPTKVLQSTKTASTKDTKVDAAAKARKAHAAAGTTDSAAEMFLARWSK
jgi:hypothetical protein